MGLAPTLGDDLSSPLIVIGASARAAAQSARRVGREVFAIDLFGDTDLQRIATTRVLSFEEYPNGFLDALNSFPKAPLIYTGGLENHPDVVDRLALQRPLYGNAGESLRIVRDPFFLSRILRKYNLPALELAETAQPGKRNWLKKPKGKSAGMGIHQVAGTEIAAHPDYYFQEFCPGEPHSAIFLAHPRETRLLALNRQLIGTSWLGASGFLYAGNIGPLPVNEELKRQLQAMGDAVAHECGLRGLFGIDFLLHQEQAYLVEVNPRYTAAVELYERVTDYPLLRDHLACFEKGQISAELANGKMVEGKAILYARVDFPFPHGRELDASWADLPRAGQPQKAGWPVCMRFASGADAAEVLKKLQQRAEETYRLFR
ncbi:ATP-grasp domain-containing protein [Telmatocola sphagniphila]|uniref:ATP-grasp domain-containing protein n=1 Tax=Telmatocola sphagniphila TaxID=1123043 RepID=A0A8E6B3X1_9BACT|nr:ATP-grasp domain-containing protein [Telmatocola sphagniphila]QVL30872.1 ATP-grasp domain-containing protein [Telmatocola sphagniphila]